MNPKLVTLRVWGDFACFTRPEMKVERVSYAVMTPSAARGILEAVFWEPQMYYLVDAIRVVKRGRWVSFRRNEVTKVISLNSAKIWMNAPEKTTPIHAGGGAVDGTQRNMLALQDVEYLITAEIRTTPLANRPEDKLEKYLSEFERRARMGKCFHRPGLGMREFAADFEWQDDPAATWQRRHAELGTQAIGESLTPPEPMSEDLGLMLYDVFDHRERNQGFRWLDIDEIAEREREFEVSLVELKKSEKAKRRKEFPGDLNLKRSNRPPIQPRPAFFHARLNQSKMDCHPARVQILTQQSGGR